MASLRQLGRLSRSPHAIGLLVQTYVAVAVTRIALWVLPSRVVLRGVAAVTRRVLRHARPQADPSRHPLRLGRGVAAAARRVPAASCLTQALAAQMLLARYGHASRLRVGVARGAAGELLAHAWVESAGGVVVGGEMLDRYTVLPDLEIALR